MAYIQNKLNFWFRQILQRTEQKEAAAAETFFFSVFPRKVTESQPRLVIILDHPVNTRSTLRVYAQRAGRKRKNMETLLMCNRFAFHSSFYLICSILLSIYYYYLICFRSQYLCRLLWPSVRYGRTLGAPFYSSEQLFIQFYSIHTFL